MRDVEPILRAHELFVAWCSHKETVLATVAHVYPPQHGLRIAVSRALCGDPLSFGRLLADNAACLACSALGVEEFTRLTGAQACTELFYGSSLRALVAGDAAPKAPPHGRHSQWLTLEEWVVITDLARLAEVFVSSAHALTGLPRVTRKLDVCERRWLDSWGKALRALRGVSVDTRALRIIEMALRRRGLPSDVSALIRRLFVSWPRAMDDAPRTKRRRAS